MKPEWKTCLRIGVSAFVLYLCISYWDAVASFLGALIGAASPLIIGAAIAYVVNILMSFYERHYFRRSNSSAVTKSRRGVCLILALATVIGIAVIVLQLVVPELVDCIQLIIAEVPGALTTVADYLMSTELFSDSEWLNSLIADIDIQSSLRNALDVIFSGLGSTVNVAVNVLTGIFSGTVTACLGIIFACYILLGRDRLGSQIKRVESAYLSPKWSERIKYVLDVLNSCFHSFIVGQCTEAVILGVLCALGMLIFGFPYATMIGAFVGAMALIPIAGAYIGGAVGFLLILTQSPIKALLFVVYLVILQQLEGNLIYPRVVGGSIGLPGIWVLAAITVGGGCAGIVGMLVAVPLTASIYRLIKNDVAHRESLAVAASGVSPASPPPDTVPTPPES